MTEASLPVPVPMTLTELAAFLHPPISAASLGIIVSQLPKLTPIGHRPTGGRPVALYDAGQVQQLHDALRAWL